jgi:fumarylacetoacetase
MTVDGLDGTHDPSVRSFVASADGHPDFPLQNLPLGVFRRPGGDLARGGVRIGDEILDLAGLAASELLSTPALEAAHAASAPELNDLFALGAHHRRALRADVHRLLRADSTDRHLVAALLHPVADCHLLLPAHIGDFTDFYAGIHHARAVGALFRPGQPLSPNYRWLPIAYHGRASSVGVSPAVVRRPRGQLRRDGAPPVYAPTQRLDFELELGVWIGASPVPGGVVPIGRAAEQISGFCLLNDWSARDVQKSESQPLGPFAAKSFATTVSAWVVTPEALLPYRVALERADDDPEPLEYLRDESDLASGGLDVDLEVAVSSAQMRSEGHEPIVLTASSTRHLYWTVAQLVAHHTSNGLQLWPGDLLGSGTISGPDPGGEGSLLERTHGGTVSFTLPTGESRTFLEDGDEVILRARAARPGLAPVGFGECRGVIIGPDDAV